MKITLANLTEATAQQVFDQVATHLLTQMKQSRSSPSDMCAYRGNGGTMCAAGCLIGDGEYKSSMEGWGWGSLQARKQVPVVHGQLVGDLQCVHDRDHATEWKTALAKVAQAHDLTMPTVDI